MSMWGCLPKKYSLQILTFTTEINMHHVCSLVQRRLHVRFTSLPNLGLAVEPHGVMLCQEGDSAAAPSEPQNHSSNTCGLRPSLFVGAVKICQEGWVKALYQETQNETSKSKREKKSQVHISIRTKSEVLASATVGSVSVLCGCSYSFI